MKTRKKTWARGSGFGGVLCCREVGAEDLIAGGSSREKVVYIL